MPRSGPCLNTEARSSRSPSELGHYPMTPLEEHDAAVESIDRVAQMGGTIWEALKTVRERRLRRVMRYGPRPWTFESVRVIYLHAHVPPDRTLGTKVLLAAKK